MAPSQAADPTQMRDVVVAVREFLLRASLTPQKELLSYAGLSRLYWWATGRGRLPLFLLYLPPHLWGAAPRLAHAAEIAAQLRRALSTLLVRPPLGVSLSPFCTLPPLYGPPRLLTSQAELLSYA